jgi:DNA-binding response OmpR family regulator
MKTYRNLPGILNSATDKNTGGTTTKKKILIVEDNELTLKIINRLLAKDFDHEVISKSNGLEAYEYAKEHIPELIILDLMLPGMGGFEILKKIRENSIFEDTKVVLVSAKSRSEDIKRGFDLTADEYIKKPFQPQEFNARIRKLLKKDA